MFKFVYKFLFIDQQTRKISHTKFWSNVGYLIMCASFGYIVYSGSTEIDYMMWMMFGAIVIGNRTAKEILTKGKSNGR